MQLLAVVLHELHDIKLLLFETLCKLVASWQELPSSVFSAALQCLSKWCACNAAAAHLQTPSLCWMARLAFDEL
jgi:hypothetical protein